MLKKISVQQLTVGMHLKEFCGSWMEHPFWRTGFVITDPKDITTILASSIKEVWIDSSKGLDVADGQSAVTESESEEQVEEELRQAVDDQAERRHRRREGQPRQMARQCQRWTGRSCRSRHWLRYPLMQSPKFLDDDADQLLGWPEEAAAGSGDRSGSQ